MISAKITVPTILPQGITEEMIAKLNNNEKLMNNIAVILLQRVESNFASESDGQEAWKELMPATVNRRAKMGKWPGLILQVTGRLLSSIHTVSQHNYAGVGTNVIYAATHQLGSQRSKTTKKGITSSWAIPPRPFFSIIPEDTERIKNTIADYFKSK